MTIAKLSLVAFDTPNPLELAGFYRELAGGEITSVSDDWVQLDVGRGVDLAFQLAPDHESPQWPDGLPQQAHLDLDVEDLDSAEEQALAIGARKTSVQPSPDQWRVFLDPAGHPFCLVLRMDT